MQRSTDAPEPPSNALGYNIAFDIICSAFFKHSALRKKGGNARPFNSGFKGNTSECYVINQSLLHLITLILFFEARIQERLRYFWGKNDILVICCKTVLVQIRKNN